MSVEGQPLIAGQAEFWDRLRVYRDARRIADQARADWDLFLATQLANGPGPAMLRGATLVLGRLKHAEEAEGESRDALTAWIVALGP